jgi:hypothetical protein
VHPNSRIVVSAFSPPCSASFSRLRNLSTIAYVGSEFRRFVRYLLMCSRFSRPHLRLVSKYFSGFSSFHLLFCLVRIVGSFLYAARLWASLQGVHSVRSPSLAPALLWKHSTGFSSLQILQT